MGFSLKPPPRRGEARGETRREHARRRLHRRAGGADEGRDSSDEIARGSLRALVEAQASVHVFGFASLVEKAIKYRNSPVGVGARGTVRVVVGADFEMRRWFKNYALATKRREEQPAALAREAGGRVLLPTSDAEVMGLPTRSRAT